MKIKIKTHKSTAFLLLLFLVISSSIVYSQQKVFDGKSYILVSDSKSFVEGYKKRIPTMIRCAGSDFKTINQEIMRYSTNEGLDYSKVYSPGKVIYEPNNELLSEAEIYKLLGMGNTFISMGNNPGAKVQDYKNDYFLIPTKSSPLQVNSSDIKNIKKYFKYLASIWWKDKPGDKICDQCNSSISHGEGYINGRIENGYLYANRLYCNECMNKYMNEPGLLQKLQNNPDYCGEGLIEQVKKFAKQQ